MRHSTRSTAPKTEKTSTRWNSRSDSVGSLFLSRLLAALLLAGSAVAASAQTDFYSVANTNLVPYTNGALIRSQPIEGAPDGAAAYRVLYRSEGLHGEPIAVSGVVIIPPGPPPSNGRPIVAWA